MGDDSLLVRKLAQSKKGSAQNRSTKKIRGYKNLKKDVDAVKNSFKKNNLSVTYL